MTHDPLCPTHRSNSAWLIRPRDCDYCKVIAKVREDERAKCIAAVEATRADAKWPQDVDDAIAALRALETP